jgi:hypothetical protein
MTPPLPAVLMPHCLDFFVVAPAWAIPLSSNTKLRYSGFHLSEVLINPVSVGAGPSALFRVACYRKETVALGTSHTATHENLSHRGRAGWAGRGGFT